MLGMNKLSRKLIRLESVLEDFKRRERAKSRKLTADGRFRQDAGNLKKLFRHLPPEEEGGVKFLERFRVDKNNPLLVGVILALRGLEEIARENTGVPEQSGEVTKYFAGGMDAFEEAQGRIADLVTAAAAAVQAESEAQERKKRREG